MWTMAVVCAFLAFMLVALHQEWSGWWWFLVYGFVLFFFNTDHKRGLLALVPNDATWKRVIGLLIFMVIILMVVVAFMVVVSEILYAY